MKWAIVTETKAGVVESLTETFATHEKVWQRVRYLRCRGYKVWHWRIGGETAMSFGHEGGYGFNADQRADPNCGLPVRHVTARTCPFDPDTGKFQSEVAEAAYQEAVRHGFIDRNAFRQVLQAHNAAEDRSNQEYAAF